MSELQSAIRVLRENMRREQEWIRRAQLVWNRRLQNVSDQDAEQSDNNAQVEQ